MLSPIAPHASEEIYQELFAKLEGYKSLALAAFPQADAKLMSEEAEKKGELLNCIIGEMRRTKRERKLPLNAELARISVSLPEGEAKLLEGMGADIKAISRAKEFAVTKGEFGVVCE